LGKIHVQLVPRQTVQQQNRPVRSFALRKQRPPVEQRLAALYGDRPELGRELRIDSYRIGCDRVDRLR
jgi:hypothetical protein